MKGLILVVLVGLVGLVGTVDAGQWGIQAHIASKHYVDGDYNEFNPGIGFVYRGEFSVVGGLYHNSNSQQSEYAAIGQTWGRWSLYGGVATGYIEGDTDKLVPVVFGQYRMGRAVFSVLPMAVGFGVEF